MSQSHNFDTIYLNPDQVTIAETSVPFVFTEDDILHYILIEQARLFPTLDQEIYFDFLIKNINEESNTIIIAACNKKSILDLDCSVLFLKIKDENLEALNLLPWRQRNKKILHKKRLKMLVITAVITSFLMLTISLFYIYIAYQDKKHAINLSHIKHVMLLKINALEKSNQEVQTLADHWGNKIHNARDQLELENILKMVEIQRPENIVLNKISWKANRVLLQGEAKEISAVKAYLKHLTKNKINAQLKFMGNSTQKTFSVQFEIEVIGKEK